MAMTHAQLFLSLFVSFFLVPAILGASVEIERCSPNPTKDEIIINKVEIIPYPVTVHDNPTFRITGFIKESYRDVPKYAVVPEVIRIKFYRYSSDLTSYSVTYYLCHVIKCPINPGPFVANITNVYRNDALSGDYVVEIDFEGFPNIYRGCVKFEFHANAMPKFDNYPRVNGISVSKVEIIPYKVTVKDSPVFRVTGVTPKSITNNSTVVVTMMLEGRLPPDDYASSRVYNICDCMYGCHVNPIPPKSLLELTFPNPYWKYKIKPASYVVIVRIFNEDSYLQERMYLVFKFPVTEV